MAKAVGGKKKTTATAAKPSTKSTSKATKPASATKVATAAKLPAVAVKPKKATAPSQPLPPPPPPPPAERDEMLAPRDIGRLLRYGEKFGDKKIDIRMQQTISLPITGTSIAIFDPANPKKSRVFDRPSGAGNFRVMLSVAIQDGKPERLAALIVHVGRPPIAKWTVAHYAKDKKPKSPDALPRVASESGWLAVAETPTALNVSPPASVAPVVLGNALAVPSGTGEFAAYWAVDATDKPICLVIDFDVLTQKDWKSKPS